MEKIFYYLFYDIQSLRACSLTCHLWCSFARPLLYFYLTTDRAVFGDKPIETQLKDMHKLKLLPFVKQLCIRQTDDFTPKQLSSFYSRYSEAFKDLQELGIDHLRVSEFVNKRGFKHFAPILRFLALKDPRGSSREILYFIGLFPNLQDLKIHDPVIEEEKENTANSTLVPPSIPPLRGWLILAGLTGKLVTDLIALFGKGSFRHMDLFMVNGAQQLLDWGANTLETLRLYPTDPYGESLSERNAEAD